MNLYLLLPVLLIPQLLCTTTVTQLRSLPCNHGDPLHGSYSVSHVSGLEVHSFHCNDGYELLGEATANCLPSGYLDVLQKLPPCAAKKPRTAHVKMQYALNCDSEHLDQLKDVIGDYFKSMPSLSAGNSSFNEIKHVCTGENKLLIEAVFTVQNQEGHNEIDSWARQMNKEHGTRKKRFDFDTIVPDNPVTDACEPGNALSVDGDSCVECTSGYFEDNGKCEECPIGTYQPLKEQTECTACVAPKTTLSTASNEETDCVAVCTIPTSLYNVGYASVTTGAKTEDDSVAVGESLTMSCSEGFIYENVNTKEIVCATGTTVYPDECYKPMIKASPAGDVYKFTDETATITCSVESTYVPSFEVKGNDDTSFTIVAVDANVLTIDTTQHTQKFSVVPKSATGGKTIDLNCEATIGDLKHNGALDKLKMRFFEFNKLGFKATETQNKGTGYDILVKVSDDSDASTVATFQWWKDDVQYSNAVLEDVTVTVGTDTFKYHESRVSFAQLQFDDAATWKVSLEISDDSRATKLTKAAFILTELKVRGFSQDPYHISTEVGAVSLQKDTAVTLTCLFDGTIESTEELKWLDATSLTEITSGTQSDTANSDVTTSLLTFTNWPADLINADKWICVVRDTTTTSNINIKSAVIEVTSLAYTATLTESSICVADASTSAITCQASLESINGDNPAISWYKKASSGSDTLVQAGVGVYSTNEETKDGKLQSILTLTDLGVNEDGEYYCQAYYDVTVTTIKSSDFELHVYKFSANDVKYALSGGTVKFSPTYTGPTLLSAVWSEEYDYDLSRSVRVTDTSTNDYSIEIKNIDSSLDLLLTATIDNTCANTIQIVYTATLTMLASTIGFGTATHIASTNKYHVASGAEVIIDCSFPEPDGLDTPTATWTTAKSADETAITTPTNNSPRKKGMFTTTLSTVTYADHAGTYACQTDYGDYGTAVSNDITLVILGPSLRNLENIYPVINTKADITCTFTGYGGAITWQKDTTDISAGIDTKALVKSSGEVTSTLTIDAVQASDADTYSCKMVFTGTQAEITLQTQLNVIAVPTLTSSATKIDGGTSHFAKENSEIKFTCTYKYVTGMPQITVKWMTTKTSGDGTDIDISSTDNTNIHKDSDASVVITLATVTYAAHAGTYKCEVDYGGQAVESVDQTLIVIGTKETKEVYSVVDTEAILTCIFTGHSGTVTWTLDGTTASGTPSTTTIVQLSGEVVSTLTTTAEDSKKRIYTCEMEFTGISEKESLKPVLNVIEVADVAVTPQQYGEVGEKVSITCKTVTSLPNDNYFGSWTWKLKGPNGLDDTETDEQEITKVIASAVIADNGEYTCSLTFDSQPAPEKKVDVYVRSILLTTTAITTSKNKYYVAKGSAVTLTCKAYGDALADSDGLVWTGTGTGTSSAVTYDSTLMLTEVTLSIAELTQTTTLSCAVTYKDGSSSKKERSLEHTLLEPIISVVSGSLASVIVGGATTLVCAPGDITGTFKWTKDGTEIQGQTSDKLVFTNIQFASAASYTCKVMYGTGINVEVDSAPSVIFVQGIETFTQINLAQDSFNDVGETITLQAQIRFESTPTTFVYTYHAESGTPAVVASNSPAAAFKSTNVYTVDMTFRAEKPSSGNRRSIRLAVTSPSHYLDVPVDIYDQCKLQDLSTTQGISLLTGQTIDHMAIVEKLSCGAGKAIEGGTKVQCTDGTSVYSQPNSDVPTCVEVEIETPPKNQFVGVGGTATLTCVSSSTSVTITSIKWFKGDGTEVATKTDFGGTSGPKVYSSEHAVTGAADNGTPPTYYCELGGSNLTLKSATVTIYIVGLAKRTAIYPGSYFETDEEAEVVFQVYSGAGTISTVGTYTASTADAAIQSVSFTAEASASGVTPYKYTVEPAKKVTGTYEIKVTYTLPADTEGENVFDYELPVAVYSPCDATSVTAVTDGTWAPSTGTVRHMDVATLSCGATSFMQGDGKALCQDSKFEDLSPEPTCETTSELTCGPLRSPVNGAVVYTDSNTASYICDVGYALFGTTQDVKYTCDTSSGFWSAVTADNPNADPPLCQETIVADSRFAVATMIFTVASDICSDEAMKQKTGDALQKALEDADIVRCTTAFACTVDESTCTYSSPSITVTFKLTQTAALDDKTYITDDTARITSEGGDVTFSVDDSSKKRATVSATVTSSSASAAVTDCPTDSISIDNTCSKCPAGYGKDTVDGTETCSICPLRQYNEGDNVATCKQCTGSFTTMVIGSTTESQCIDANKVCTVKDAGSNEVFVPPSKARVLANKFVTLTCASNFDKEYDTDTLFKCNQAAYPNCYATCSLASFTEAVLKEKFIHSPLNQQSLLHNEVMSVTCMTGYEVAEDMPAKDYTCSNGKLPEFTTCVKKSTSKVMTAIIVIVVVLGLAVILLFIFILIQWRKKKQTAYKVSGKKLGFVDPIENMAAEEGSGVPMNKVSLKLSEADKKAPLMSRPVHISDFSKYYDLLTRNDDKELRQEFVTFDSFDDNNTCYHGSIPENDSKNRYKNIIPFDHSRVKLSIIGDDVHSDYVNASYIHGYHKPRVFIATQAPLYETLDDFWRMMWEKKSTMIVNLTKVEENGKIKSIVYWPSVEERTKRFGKVSVNRVDKQESDNFVVYTFQLKHLDEEETREIYAFNYVGWPDFDVPTRSNEFVDFIFNIRHTLFVKPPLGPIVCHCSAGTGRTGAFIGIMNSLDRLIHKEDLDTLGLVGSLRQQRRKMVFTYMQYKYLHRVILDVVNSDELETLRQNGFRRKMEVRGVVENQYISTSDSDELDDLNDTKV